MAVIFHSICAVLDTLTNCSQLTLMCDKYMVYLSISMDMGHM